MLRLADAGALTPAGVRQLLPQVLVPARAGEPAEEASMPRRLVASWAGNLPMAERDGDWLVVAEELLKDTSTSLTPATWPTRPRAAARTPTAGRCPS